MNVVLENFLPNLLEILEGFVWHSDNWTLKIRQSTPGSVESDLGSNLRHMDDLLLKALGFTSSEA